MVGSMKTNTTYMLSRYTCKSLIATKPDKKACASAYTLISYFGRQRELLNKISNFYCLFDITTRAIQNNTTI